jgi:hypothetical protein
MDRPETSGWSQISIARVCSRRTPSTLHASLARRGAASVVNIAPLLGKRRMVDVSRLHEYTAAEGRSVGCRQTIRAMRLVIGRKWPKSWHPAFRFGDGHGPRRERQRLERETRWRRQHLLDCCLKVSQLPVDGFRLVQGRHRSSRALNDRACPQFTHWPDYSSHGDYTGL